MISPLRSAQRLGVLFLLASTWSTLTDSLALNLCSSINTGSTPKNISIYQTNGLCHDFCVDDYAFAITQGNACWCSNYAPAKAVQKDMSSCDTPCPAFPDENCGGKGVYGYVSLDNVLPSGTQGGSTSTSEAKPTTAISKVTETVQNTVTVTPAEPTTTSSSSTSTQETTTATPSTTSTKSSSTTEEKPTSLVQTVTADGTVRTVTVAPTRTGTTVGDNSHITVKNKGLNTGQVVGIVVGIIAAVIGAAGLALFFWFRRKKQQRNDEDFQDDPSVRDSSSGMVSGGRPEMSMSGVSPISPAVAASNSRNSTLQVDPRMDPFKQGLYVRSASHESVNTLRDDHDYSRRILRATNPDPEPNH